MSSITQNENSNKGNDRRIIVDTAVKRPDKPQSRNIYQGYNIVNLIEDSEQKGFELKVSKTGHGLF